MTTTAKTRHSDGLRRGGLDWNVPQDGKAADAYEVACTAAYLMRTPRCDGGRDLQPARHATRLHVISGLLHKLAERQCNEDLACPKCSGEGWVHPNASTLSIDCPACAGTGLTIGRKLESLKADAREIAQHYGLTCYFQTDPRGCSLYLIDPAMIPADIRHWSMFSNPTYHGFTDEELRREWINCNYNRGHAMVRLGR